MRCIYCGTPLSSIDYCTGCGADVTLQKRIARISNLLYNEGLEKAQVRDLSGAIACLKRSLKFNKENVAARNLLGLVYFETGEVVSALSEWVISKNLNVPDNVADVYIAKLQANKNKLDTINQTIRKCNQALLYCRQDNEDMAMIQLKKVLVQNPKFIKAYHLLALLYLKRQEYEKARKLLKKAAYIDNTNTTTLRYLKEVELATGMSTSLETKHKKKYAREETVNRLTGATTYMSGNEMIIQPATFRESSAVATFLNICLGLILGGAIVWFLAVPATRQSVNASANKQVTDANTKMAQQVAQVQGLEDQIETYQSEVEEANKTRDDANKKVDSYDQLLKATQTYLSGDQSSAASQLTEVDGDSMTGEGEKLYTSLNTLLQDYVFNEAYNKAGTAYMAGDYATAITEYTKAVAANPDSFDAINYLAWSYKNSGDAVNADKTFKEALQKFPAKASEIQPYITNASSGTTTQTAETDADGNPIDQTQETDANGNPIDQIAETDAEGNPIDQTAETDANGNPISQTQETDANGNPVTTIQ